ncbi:MAG: LTA synthase family protein [Oscillospiraceae bacterium]|nr:LTA synthase family protein [Oscillospiraceae bacterium]
MYRSLHWAVNICVLLIWSAGLSSVSLYFARHGYGRELFFSYFQNASLFLLNFAPVLILVFVLYMAANRVWMSVLLSGLIVIVFSLINYFKIAARGDPLLASDTVYMIEAARISGNYIFIEASVIAVIITTAAAAAISYFLFKARMPGKKSRAAGLAALLVSGFFLYATVYRSPDVYEKTSNLDIRMSNGKVMSQWSETDQYVCRGFIYPFINSTVRLGDGRPEGYDRSEAKNILASYAYDDISENKKVNVIILQLEAYGDFSALGVEFGADPYEYFRVLRDESISGNLITNVFAGDTIDTERTFITGSTVKYEYRKKAFSYARYFGEQGYFTEFCHPCYGWFYNRQNVFEYLGFDSLYFFETRYTMPDGWGMMHDGQFFRDLVKLFEEATSRERPYFNFSVTYQNHGPYESDRRQSGVDYIANADMSEEGRNIAENYFAGIHETDEALRDFIEYFRRSDEPVIIALFGDHMPWMGEGARIYEELGINLDLSREDGFYNYYGTPYVIWANGAAKDVLGKEFIGRGGDISPCFFMTLIFDSAGWGGNELMKQNRELKEHTSLVHKTKTVVSGGVLTEEIPADLGYLLDKYDRVQYYLMRDRF